MDLRLYNSSSVRTQRAMCRHRKKYGHPYEYQPRRTIVARWMKEQNWTEEQVREQLQKERKYLLKTIRGVDIP